MEKKHYSNHCIVWKKCLPYNFIYGKNAYFAKFIHFFLLYEIVWKSIINFFFQLGKFYDKLFLSTRVHIQKLRK